MTNSRRLPIFVCYFLRHVEIRMFFNVFHAFIEQNANIVLNRNRKDHLMQSYQAKFHAYVLNDNEAVTYIHIDVEKCPPSIFMDIFDTSCDRISSIID